MKYLLPLFSILVASSSAFASETDAFTLRGKLSDARQWLNAKMNASLDQAAANTESCNPIELQKVLYKDLGGLFVANIETWSEESPLASHLPIEKSIYVDVADQKGNHSWRKMTKFGAYYSPGQYNVNGNMIGEDKLGHFFQLGYSMFHAVQYKRDSKYPDVRTLIQRAAERFVGDTKYVRKARAKNDELLVLDFSRFQESTEWGLTATLVRSYADMSANYSGYFFWTELTDGENPYYSCQSGRWQRAREFDWGQYVTPAWDEAINCSDYDQSIASRVNAQIKKRGLGQCPISAEACGNLVDYYGPVASKKILHPRCLKAAGQ